MAETKVAIGQVKRDMSELVNRVAYGGERIVLTSRGKPKAALVSLDDYERLQQEQVRERVERYRVWVDETNSLASEILEGRGGEPVDVDELMTASREELEARDEQALGH